MSRRTTAVIATAMVLAGCAAQPSATERSAVPDGAGAGLAVAATVFPLAWLAEQIAPGADVTFLGARGQDPHDLELSPGDRALLETADVVLYAGDVGFQPQVERAVQASTGAVVSLAEVAGPRLLSADQAEDDEHADDDHAEEDAEVVDPHSWFDAAIMADAAEAAGAAFAAADPQAAAAYEHAAARTASDLRDLGRELDALLSGCARDTAIVSHEAYAYLLEPHGLEQEGISGAGGHAEASPRRLAELTDRIRAQGIRVVLAEPFEGRADAEALAAEAGVELAEIDPLEVATDEQRAAGYPALLRQTAEAFARALDCADA